MTFVATSFQPGRFKKSNIAWNEDFIPPILIISGTFYEGNVLIGVIDVIYIDLGKLEIWCEALSMTFFRFGFSSSLAFTGQISLILGRMYIIF